MKESEMQYVKYCQNCGAVTKVKDSRAGIDGTVWRRRICNKCGFAFNTIEVEEDMYKQPTRDVKLVYPQYIRMREENGKLVTYRKEEE